MLPHDWELAQPSSRPGHGRASPDLKVFILLFAGMIGIAQLSHPVAGSEPTPGWPMYGHDVGRSGFGDEDPPSRVEEVVTSSAFSSAQMLASSMPIASSGLILVDGVQELPPDAYPSFYAYRLFALDAGSGKLVWSYEPVLPNSNAGYVTRGWWNETGPAVVGSTVVLAVYDRIAALDLRTGRERWSHMLDDALALGHPAPTAPIADGEMTAAAVNVNLVGLQTERWRGAVVALSTETGGARWQTVFGDPLHAVAMERDAVITATWSGKVCSLDRESGFERWCVRLDESISAPPSIRENYTYVGTANGELHALSLANGTVVWTASLRGVQRGPATLTPDAVFVGTLGAYPIPYRPDAPNPFGMVYRLNHTGDVAWSRDLSLESNGTAYSGVFGAISAGPTRIAFVNWQTVEVRSAATGELLWRYPLPRGGLPWHPDAGLALTSLGIAVTGYPEVWILKGVASSGGLATYFATLAYLSVAVAFPVVVIAVARRAVKGRRQREEER